MRRLAKNLILATAVVSAIFIVDLSSAEASNLTEKNSEQSMTLCPEFNCRYLDFWSKFRDTVMPDPDEPQNNNPPKKDDEPEESKETHPAKPPKVVTPKPAPPPKVVTPKPMN